MDELTDTRRVAGLESDSQRAICPFCDRLDCGPDSRASWKGHEVISKEFTQVDLVSAGEAVLWWYDRLKCFTCDRFEREPTAILTRYRRNDRDIKFVLTE